ncbi:hypothetical protein FGF1_36370 [Flavobacteriaceae bacterium GF1]
MKSLMIGNGLIALLIGISSFGQSTKGAVPMNIQNWELSERDTTVFETFDGRETVVLNGEAILKNENFVNGTIELEIYANDNRSFAGIIFRKQEDTMEEVLIRCHKSNQVDAMQYTPIFHKETNWQLYREYQAKVAFKKKGWNKLKLAVVGHSATVFLNDKEVFSIDHLRTSNKDGEIGIFSLYANRFSNFRFSKSDSDYEGNTIPANKSTNPSMIRKWYLSEGFPFQKEDFSLERALKLPDKEVNTESSGLLPISKYVRRKSAGRFENNREYAAIVSKNIEVDKDTIRRFSFDFSDRVTVYLNMKPIFSGNNAFRAKGPQHTGHLDIDTNVLHLNLKEGNNTLHCLVIDKANGWGFMGKLD